MTDRSTGRSGYWAGALIEQLEWHWGSLVRPRLDDLTDEEYLWEPVRGCWSIRPSSESTSPLAFGIGDAKVDYDEPELAPPPVTTIAWRMAHVAIGVFGDRAANHFGDGNCHYADIEYALTARGGLALLDHHHDAWITGLRSLDDDGLALPVGESEGPWAASPMSDLILHINREAIHHGAEMLALRDLYRNQSPTP